MLSEQIFVLHTGYQVITMGWGAWGGGRLKPQIGTDFTRQAVLTPQGDGSGVGTEACGSTHLPYWASEQSWASPEHWSHQDSGSECAVFTREVCGAGASQACSQQGMMTGKAGTSWACCANQGHGWGWLNTSHLPIYLVGTKSHLRGRKS